MTGAPLRMAAERPPTIHQSEAAAVAGGQPFTTATIPALKQLKLTAGCVRVKLRLRRIEGQRRLGRLDQARRRPGTPREMHGSETQPERSHAK
mmetsp:Transcript_13849/g.44319  ORF Transcript_13849/g.44319 Transcript_13849/m.44319 type:complete len:93 (+) Transcript_13849:2321-2599(+)